MRRLHSVKMPSPFAERIRHECFRQPADIGRRVWRYMTLAKFTAMLQTGRLHLSRLDLLNDPHEGSLPKVVWASRQKFFEESNLSHALPMLAGVGRRMRMACYVSCWALSDFE